MKLIVEHQINHVYLKVVDLFMMEKDKTDPKTTKSTESNEEATDGEKDPSTEDTEEPEYVGLPDRDLKKNLGCG